MSYPLTSIIILTKNNIQFTERCIWSIYDKINPKLTPYEILVLDEGSVDGTKEFCEQHKANVKYIDGSQYKSFGSRNNFGVRQAKGEFFWMLNNDVELMNDNLQLMLRHFANPEIAAVSGRHIFPDGTLNHIGMAFLDDLTPTHLFPHEDREAPYIAHGRFMEIVTSASVVFRKDVYEAINGYSEEYTWGYEDVDICLKIKEIGKLIYVDHDATLIHHGQSTHGRTDGDDKNREIFLKKWKDKIKPNFKQLYKEKEDYLNKDQKLTRLPAKFAKRVAKSGVAIAKNLVKPRDKGPEVPLVEHYIFKAKDFSALRKIADDIHPEMPEGTQVLDSISALKRVKDRPENGAMLFSTTHYYPDYITWAPDWVRDYRTFDVNYERTDYSNPDYWIESIKQGKMHILASSNFCKDFLIKSGIEKSRIDVVHHGYKRDMLDFDFPKERQEKKTVGFAIINTNDDERYGTDRLAEAIEKLGKSNPELLKNLKLIIKNYGGEPTRPFFRTKEYQVFLRNGLEIELIEEFISEADLAKLYYRADFFIAPFRGEGFGMKILDAAVAGLPILCPNYSGPKDYLKYAEHVDVKYKLKPVGWGIDNVSLLQDETYVFADVDSTDLAKKIESTVKNIDKLKKQALKKRDYLRENFSWKKKWEKIVEIDKALVEKQNLNEFEFYDAKFALDKKTSGYQKLNPKKISQTLLINTIRPNNLIESFTHMESLGVLNELKGEVLIIDDASPENPTELLKKFDHLPIRYMKYKEWGGSGFAREVGLKHAKGDNIVIIGDDIKPMPGFFNLHYSHYLNNPEPYLLMGHVEWDKGIRNDVVAEYTTKITGFQFGFEEIRNQKEITYWHVYTPNVSFRKSDIEKAKQHFKIGMILFEDTIWAKELYDKGFRIYYNRKAYALHNHRLKEGMDWLQWFQSRSRAIGNCLQAYTKDIQFEEFLNISNNIIKISQAYSANSKEEFKVLEQAFDSTLDRLVSKFYSLEKIDKKEGYNGKIRTHLYEILADIYHLNRGAGMVEGMNPNTPEYVRKAISYILYVNNKKDLKNDIRVELESTMGMEHTLSLFISKGRQRAPWLFNPIFKLTKMMKMSR